MRCTEYKSGLFVDLFTWLCRIWGIATAIGLWGIGIETAWRKHHLGIYLVVLAAIFSLLESIFIVNFWIKVCNRDGPSFCHSVWKVILKFNTWKKGAVYLFLSVGCFVQPHSVKLAVVSGVMILVCSMLYFIQTYVVSKDKPEQQQMVKSPTYDRFDDLPEDLEEPQSDRSSNQIVRSPSQDFNSLADQDQILEV